jgi:hypothetical protein
VFAYLEITLCHDGIRTPDLYLIVANWHWKVRDLTDSGQSRMKKSGRPPNIAYCQQEVSLAIQYRHQKRYKCSVSDILGRE